MTGWLAVLRWVLKLVRTEWREHALVIAMMAFGIAIATLLISSAVRLTDPLEREFETPAFVSIVALSDGSDSSAAIQAGVREVQQRHPDTEVQVLGPRGTGDIALLGADPTAPLGSQNFVLLEGRWPQRGETAITTQAQDLLAGNNADADAGGAELGSRIELAGSQRVVVGVWENPTDITRSVALTPIDESETWDVVRALLPSADHRAGPDYVDLGVSAGSDPTGQPLVGAALRVAPGRSQDAATVAYLAGALLCLQIAVFASAGFSVLADRRIRELGMLSAMGASATRIGSVMRLTGLVCGTLSGIIGLVIGVLLTAASTPIVQNAVHHRLSPTEIPLRLVLPTVPLAIVAALAAAWWPARHVAKISAIDAINARRESTRRRAAPSVIAAFLVLAGLWSVAWGLSHSQPVGAVGGGLVLVVGLFLVIPNMIAGIGWAGGFAPLSLRIACRDIARHHTRSVSAIATVAVALAVPMALTLYIESVSDSWVPDVPEHVIEVGLVDAVTDDAAAFDPLVDLVASSSLLRVNAPADPEDPIRPIEIVSRRGDNEQPERTAFATPELLDAIGLEQAMITADVISFTDRALVLPTDGHTVEVLDPVPGVFPTVLILQESTDVSPSTAVTTQWLLVNDGRFTSSEKAAIADFARDSGRFRIDLPDDEEPFAAIKTAATIIAGLLSLSVVVIALSLIGLESRRQTQTLAAIGAGPSLQRRVGAFTAVTLVAQAMVLAIPGVAAIMAGLYTHQSGDYPVAVPWGTVATIVILPPAAAAIAGLRLTDAAR